LNVRLTYDDLELVQFFKFLGNFTKGSGFTILLKGVSEKETLMGRF